MEKTVDRGDSAPVGLSLHCTNISWAYHWVLKVAAYKICSENYTGVPFVDSLSFEDLMLRNVSNQNVVISIR